MGKAKVTRKFAAVKRMITPKDSRVHAREAEKEVFAIKRSSAKDPLQATQIKKRKKPSKQDDDELKQVDPVNSSMFFSHNESLGPPYHIIVDTNFINFSIQNKLEIFQTMMDCLLAKCTAYLTDCVVGELERLGPKFRIALRISRDPRFKRLKCTHKGIYADDCIVDRVKMHKIYIIATNDKDLRRRLRKIPGVPIMYVTKKKYSIERLPDAYGAPK
mmetsp:Transcript_3601/g.5906  ORF Transcript_3601/g.5906 Transcript_3601/m.5906 type:complete len:217 (+) Transcript_3601:80-730(+)